MTNLESKTAKSDEINEIRMESFPNIYCSRRFIDVLTEIIEMGGYPHADTHFFDRNKDNLRLEHYEMLRRLPLIPCKPTGKLKIGVNCKRRAPRQHSDY